MVLWRNQRGGWITCSTTTIYIYIYIYELAVFYLTSIHQIPGRVRNDVPPPNPAKTNAFCYKPHQAADHTTEILMSAPITDTRTNRQARCANKHVMHLSRNLCQPLATSKCPQVSWEPSIPQVNQPFAFHPTDQPFTLHPTGQPFALHLDTVHSFVSLGTAHIQHVPPPLNHVPPTFHPRSTNATQTLCHFLPPRGIKL